MRKLTINIEDSVFDKLYYFIKNLPKKDVQILTNEKIHKTKNCITIDFSKYKINSFSNIVDPVKFQQSLRDEWDR